MHADSSDYRADLYSRQDLLVDLVASFARSTEDVCSSPNYTNHLRHPEQAYGWI